MNDERKKSKLKFVSLHGHDVLGSPLDAIGYPSEYMDFAYENGMDAIAFTNHGNCNGLSYQALHIKEMKKQGKDFKTIYGVEAYYHPDLDKWREDYKAFKELKKDDKDDDEFGLPRESAIKIASKQITESIINNIISTW